MLFNLLNGLLVSSYSPLTMKFYVKDKFQLRFGIRKGVNAATALTSRCLKIMIGPSSDENLGSCF